MKCAVQLVRVVAGSTVLDCPNTTGLVAVGSQPAASNTATSVAASYFAPEVNDGLRHRDIGQFLERTVAFQFEAWRVQ